MLLLTHGLPARVLPTKVITEIRKNDSGERIKVERTVKVGACCLATSSLV